MGNIITQSRFVNIRINKSKYNKAINSFVILRFIEIIAAFFYPNMKCYSGQHCMYLLDVTFVFPSQQDIHNLH